MTASRTQFSQASGGTLLQMSNITAQSLFLNPLLSAAKIAYLPIFGNVAEYWLTYLIATGCLAGFEFDIRLASSAP